MDIDSLAHDVLDISLTAAQRTALAAITSGRDVLAVLPTGSGKSAIYQLGGLALGGLTVVVSPLIALQRDQLRSLERHRAARVAMLNSTQKAAERAAALAALGSGELDFLLLGPEQLANVQTHRALLASPRRITMLAVDEAHLVSEWGHDFRPEYLRLGDTITGVGRPQIVALTATAAPPVQTEITRELGMRSPVVVVADFDRPNIRLAVRRAHTYPSEELAVVDRVVEVVLAHETPALVYAPSHARCTDIAERLQRAGVRAAAYHAGLGAEQRAEVQDAFFAGRLDVVAATSAFGMGIDKPDVRTVVHAGVPSSVDEYYQEIGRAGRDGQPANAVLVYDERTLRIPRLFASRTRIPPAAVQAVVAALGGSTQISVAELTRASKVSRQTVDRVIAELSELGLLTIDDDGCRDARRCRPTPATRSTPRAAAGRPSWAAGSTPSGTTPRPCIAGAPNCWPTSARRSRRPAATATTTTVRRRGHGRHGRRQADHAEPRPGGQPPCPSDGADHASIARRAPAATGVEPQQGDPAPGVIVIHRLWGPGTLLSQDDHELVVAFDSVGYRHLTPAALTNGLLTVTVVINLPGR